jgi:hypothetical protein
MLAVVVCFALHRVAEGQETESRKHYLSDDGTLKRSVILRDSQEGFVGETGEILKISTKGSWTLAQFTNEKVSKPHAEGMLSAEDLRKIADVLAKQDFKGLPKEFGRDVKVNRHQLEVRFGEKSAKLILNPRESITDIKPKRDDPEASMWTRFITIIETLKGISKSKKLEDD